MNREAEAIRKHVTSTQARGPAGYFINLDKSVGRRRAIEAELAKVGLARRYRRFAAIDGDTLKMRNHAIEPGEAGCFLSHLGVMEAGAKTGGHFHVLEDDAILSRDVAAHLAMITGDVIDNFDIVLTDMLLPFGPAFIHDLSAMYVAYRTGGTFNILAGHYWADLSSYVVNIKASGKLIRLLRDEVKAGMRLPVDLCIGNLVASGAVAVGCLFPFVTSIRQSQILETTISRARHSAAERMIVESPRAAFYIEADRMALRAGGDFRGACYRSQTQHRPALSGQIAGRHAGGADRH